jgi:hypothetical protein
MIRTRTSKSFLFAGLLPLLLSCAGSVPSPAASTWTTAPPQIASSKPVARFTGLSAPESVLYDVRGDRYLVSNLKGDSLTGTIWGRSRTNRGFISLLSPDGQVTDRTWIEDGKRGAKLDAPKGLAISGDLLYVADVAVVRTFDLRTGEPRGDVPVPGATFVADVATGDDGKVYVSDAGVPDGSFEAKGTDSVYFIEQGRARAIVAGPGLRRPQGIAWTPRGLVVGSFESNELYRLDAHGAKQDVTRTPTGGLTGIVSLGDFLFVSSWQTSTVLRGKLGGPFEVALVDQASPGRIGFDSKRARLLVPHLGEGVVEAFAIR